MPRARSREETGLGTDGGRSGIGGQFGADLAQAGLVLAGVVSAEEELVAPRKQCTGVRGGAATVAAVVAGEEGGVPGGHVVTPPQAALHRKR
jgi:hypothetical protein